MLRTKSGLPKHCGWNEDRHGKRRVRFRKNGFTTYLTGTPWSEEFMRQYAAALDGVKALAAEAGAVHTVAGSLKGTSNNDEFFVGSIAARRDGDFVS